MRIIESRCKNCFKIMLHLRVLTVEMKSAQLIIKFLQDELNYNVEEHKNADITKVKLQVNRLKSSKRIIQSSNRSKPLDV
jgi:coenzyme F420-reducing hydrogenase beta subunit